ncbi:MAG: hypothetical protein R3F43_00595 [bacterium]
MDHESWALLDLSGDGRPDLVITAVLAAGDPPGGRVFGAGTDAPYWRVFLNEGNGFADRAVRWRVPVGGRVGAGFHALGDAGGRDDGDEAWSLLDLTGDGKLDLVVTGFSSRDLGTLDPQIFGHDTGEPYWRVFAQEEGRFADRARRYQVPPAGDPTTGFSRPAGTSVDGDGLTWTTLDLDGDGWLDLVAVAERVDGVLRPYEQGGQVHWRLFAGESGGFRATPRRFVLPPGGTPGVGFNALARGDGDEGAPTWATADLDADGHLDLVILGEIRGGWSAVFGLPDAPHWRIHRGVP